MSPRPEVTERNYVPNLVEEASRALPSTTSKASKFTTVLGENFEDQPLWKRLNYLHLIILVGLPAFAVYGMLTTPLTMNVLAFSVFYYFFSGLGITAGYHRYFAHRAYEAHPVLKYLLVLMGSAAVEGSVRWWSRDHRAHHRYVDTEKDPYAATRGFWYSHMGWMLVKQDPKKIGRASVADLDADPFIKFQHKYYIFFALVMGILVPTAACGLLFGDWAGGYFYAALGRLIFVHHSTFCVNSLAHFAGDQTYSDAHTSRNSVITALVTVGEGYHNFHHEFPSDFRNGVEWYQYDPTKWFIWVASKLGLAHHLIATEQNEIEKARIQMQTKGLHAAASKIFWGPDPAALPAYTMAEVEERVKTGGEQWLVLDGFVVDAEDFCHPGGAEWIRARLGKDVTVDMSGNVYKHSNAAHNLARTRRVGRVTDAPSTGRTALQSAADVAAAQEAAAEEAAAIAAAAVAAAAAAKSKTA